MWGGLLLGGGDYKELGSVAGSIRLGAQVKVRRFRAIRFGFVGDSVGNAQGISGF